MSTLTCKVLSCQYCNQSKTDPNDQFGFCENPAPQILPNGVCSEIGWRYHKATSPNPISEECKMKSNIIVLEKNKGFLEPVEPVEQEPFMNPPEEQETCDPPEEKENIIKDTKTKGKKGTTKTKRKGKGKK